MTDSPRSRLLANIQAGTTSAVIIIPQGMAYAMVAGLEPIHGLYASLLPLIVYALFGRSRELAVGPGALDTILVGAALSALPFVTEANYAWHAALLAGLVAVIQIGLGLLRAGFVVNLLSAPVVSGFTSASAIIIATNQVGLLLGFKLPAAQRFQDLAAGLVDGVGGLDPLTAAFGLGSAVLLVLGKRHFPRAPYALAVVALATVLGALLDVSSAGVRIIGQIPAGLPSFEIPPITLDSIVALLPTALTIAFVSYLTVISIARTFADRNRYEIGPSHELVATGLMNLAAAVTRGFPVSASFSRSAVHAQAGATSPRALLVSAAWVALTLLFLTDLLRTLPKATLAAVIITAVYGLIDVKTMRHLRKVKPIDLLTLLVTFFATLFIGIEKGILIGVGVSVAAFIVETTRPHTAILGRLGDSPDFRNLRHNPDAITYPGLVILRIDAQYYFGNVTFLKSLLKRLEQESNVPLRGVLIEACSLTQLDSSAAAALRAIADDYAARGIRLMFASVKVPVLKVMQASGLYARVGADAYYMNLDDAVRDWLRRGTPDAETPEAPGRLNGPG